MEINKKAGNWKHNANLYLVSQIFSLLGSSIVDYVLIWHITIKTQSGIIMTLSLIVTFLPRVLISFFSGKWIDTHNRKLIIAAADGGIAAVSLLLAVLFKNGFDRLPVILALMFVRTIGSGLQTPSEKSFIAEIVPEEKRMQFNSWNAGILSIINLFSPMAGGFLLTYTSISLALSMDIITAFIAIFILLCIKKINVNVNNIKDKINLITSNASDPAKRIGHLSIFNFFFCILIVPITYLSNLYIVKNYGTEVWRLTLNELAYGFGGLIGSIYVSKLKRKKSLYTYIIKFLMLLGIFTALIYKLSNYFSVYFIIVAAIAFMIVSVQILLVTLVQEKYPESYHGRIFAQIEISTNTGLPLGMLLFGFLSDKINILFIFGLAGILTMVLSVYIFIYIKYKSEVF